VTSDRHRAAAHEAGHAVAAHLLGRLVTLVSLDGPTGGPCSIDKRPIEPLANRRPLPHWHATEDEILIVLAGALCENLTEQEQPTVTSGPRRVPDPPPLHPAPFAPVQWQTADEPPVWPEVPESDSEQARRMLLSITATDEEYDAMSAALTLRCEALIRHPHFAALHTHLTAALLRDGELHATQVRAELQRAELRHLTTTLEEDNDGTQAA
jgi:hypothetical protein